MFAATLARGKGQMPARLQAAKIGDPQRVSQCRVHGDRDAGLRRTDLETPANPSGLPIEVFDGLSQALQVGRSSISILRAARSKCSTDRTRSHCERRSHRMGAANAQIQFIKAFSETHFTVHLQVNRLVSVRDAWRRRLDRSDP